MECLKFSLVSLCISVGNQFILEMLTEPWKENRVQPEAFSPIFKSHMTSILSHSSYFGGVGVMGGRGRGFG